MMTWHAHDQQYSYYFLKIQSMVTSQITKQTSVFETNNLRPRSLKIKAEEISQTKNMSL
jgi:hypothetical protein